MNKKHNVLSKQNSNLSRQMLLKQDSSVSSRSLLKQDSVQSSRQILANNQNNSEQMTEYLTRQNSANSCRALLKQDSNSSILSKQNSQVSYCESKKSFSSSIDSCTDLRKESILRQNFQNAYMEQKRRTLSQQDTEISLIEENRGNLINSQDSCTSLISSSSAARRQRLVKQDSIFSFGEPIKSGKSQLNGFIEGYHWNHPPLVCLSLPLVIHSKILRAAVSDIKRREFTKQDSVVSVSFADHPEII